jgi:mannose-6-phosphate isomerase
MRAQLGRLEGAVRHYAWGSHDAIARLQGREHPTDLPEAEVWFGAHPLAPSMLHRAGQPSVPLDAAIAQDGRLPFLVKLLAAAVPLSVQVHPDQEQAERGYARDEQRGLGVDDPRRNYRDSWAKPEAIIAVGSFHALAGFRDPDDLMDLIRVLGIAEVAPLPAIVEPIRAGDVAGYPAVVEAFLRLGHDDRARLISALTDVALAEGPSDVRRQADVDTIAQLARDHPDDAGVLVALLLHRHELRDGDTLTIEPGCPHAYLHGTGVEVMGASDNVMRAGLTTKHVDVDAFLAVLRPIEGTPLHAASPAGSGPILPTELFTVERLEVGTSHTSSHQRTIVEPPFIPCDSGCI